MSQHTGEQSPLLSLPREIRNKIYDYLFESAPLTFEIHPESCAGFDKSPPFWIILPRSTFSVMLTCWSLYHETHERRFSLHWWHFKQLGALEYFNSYACKARKATVHKVSGVQLGNYRYKKNLCQLPNLRDVQVGPIRAYYSLAPNVDPSTSPTRSAKRFDDVEWDKVILAVNQAGFDWIAPYGLEPLIEKGRWDEFVLFADLDVDEVGRSRYWVPSVLNVRTKEAIRLWDQMQDSKGGYSWSQLRLTSSSSCVLAEFEKAKQDPKAFRDRWKRYMTVE